MCECNLTSCLGIKNIFLGIRTKPPQWRSLLCSSGRQQLCVGVWPWGKAGRRNSWITDGCGVGRKPSEGRRGASLRSLKLLPREAGSRHANVCHAPGSSGLRCWLRPLSGSFSVSSCSVGTLKGLAYAESRSLVCQRLCGNSAAACH